MRSVVVRMIGVCLWATAIGCATDNATDKKGEPTTAPSACALPPAEDPGADMRAPENLDQKPLEVCSLQPRTGVFRDGRCATGSADVGVHVVCASVTDEFLRYTASRGNDLTTPAREFPGLHAGDHWCLCADRWAEAQAAGVAPPVVLSATERAALRKIPRAVLESHAERK